MAEGKRERRESSSEESVKLFVGQVPKNMTEVQLLTMFREFALVDEVNIIKDKTTRASRGSFSLSFSTHILEFSLGSNRKVSECVTRLCLKNPNFFFGFCRLLLCDLSDEGRGRQGSQCVSQQENSIWG